MQEAKQTAHLISIAGEDRIGVVSAVSGYLFEIGANLADTAYAILGEGFELSCVADLDDVMTAEELEEGLTSLAELSDTRITVVKFPFGIDRPETGEVSHILEVFGGDRAGLISRFADILQEYGANIVKMNSRRVDEDSEKSYRMRFALNIPSDQLQTLDNALTNTAGSLRLQIKLTAV